MKYFNGLGKHQQEYNRFKQTLYTRDKFFTLAYHIYSRYSECKQYTEITFNEMYELDQKGVSEIKELLNLLLNYKSRGFFPEDEINEKVEQLMDRVIEILKEDF